MDTTLAFDAIYCTFKTPNTETACALGKLKLAAAGLGWKEGASGTVLTERAEDLRRLQWQRSFRGRGFQLRVELAGGSVRCFEGFGAEDAEPVSSFCTRNYSLEVSRDECSGRGWNWGRLSVAKGAEFVVGGKKAFELPLTRVSNAQVATRNELCLEFEEGVNGDDEDALTEIRFYIGEGEEGESDEGDGVSVGDADGMDEDEDEDEDENDEEDEERMDDDVDMDADAENAAASSNSKANAKEKVSLTAAEQLFQQVKSIASLGKANAVKGEPWVSFPDMACVVPRGRFRVDVFENCLRLHGRSIDYRVDWSAIGKALLVPRMGDERTLLLVLAGLDPPLKHGQTRHSHLVLQIPREAQTFTPESPLVLPPAATASPTATATPLQPQYTDLPDVELLALLVRAVGGHRIVVPGAGFRSSSPGNSTGVIRCAIKANEGALYVLERSFLFLPKPTLLISHTECSGGFVFCRVGAGMGAGSSRSFDLRLQTSPTPITFCNIARDELDGLVEYFKAKQLTFSFEAEPGKGVMLKKAKLDNAEDNEDIDEDEDESTDEDYNADDSDSEDEGSDDDEDDEDDDEEDDDDDDDEEDDE